MYESVYFQIAIELITAFMGLIVSIQVIGKRQVSQITPFDFISAIVLGELVGNAIYNPETKYYHILYTISLWTALIFIIGKLTQKYYKSRRIIQGNPTLLIKKGTIDFKAINKEHLDLSELLSMLREKDVLSVKEVEYAILETSGNITVIKKSQYNQVTLKDLNIQTKNPSLCLPIIMDGDLITNNLSLLGYNEKWLADKLRNYEITSIQEILYAEWSDDDGLYFHKKPSA